MNITIISLEKKKRIRRRKEMKNTFRGIFYWTRCVSKQLLKYARSSVKCTVSVLYARCGWCCVCVPACFIGGTRWPTTTVLLNPNGYGLQSGFHLATCAHTTYIDLMCPSVFCWTVLRKRERCFSHSFCLAYNAFNDMARINYYYWQQYYRTSCK